MVSSPCARMKWVPILLRTQCETYEYHVRIATARMVGRITVLDLLSWSTPARADLRVDSCTGGKTLSAAICGSEVCSATVRQMSSLEQVSCLGLNCISGKQFRLSDIGNPEKPRGD